MNNKKNHLHHRILTLFLCGCAFAGCTQVKETKMYSDRYHFSEVFNDNKGYRLYLPSGYSGSDHNYPVIYFFHGHGGRHFMDNNARLEYEMIQDLVNQYQVILVMWDGNIEESESRPYNIGDREHIRYRIQMKDYFPELVTHIDAAYRTIPNRESRGIIGYSMGGFMSFYIAGKYPHMVSAAVNLTGSVEFYLGVPENHTLYPLRHTFSNLRDVSVRLHNSSHGELSSLNREVNHGALYDGYLEYEYWEFEGGHKVDDPGETDVFEKAMQFVVNAFENPVPRKNHWSHYDLYKDYDVWDYSVRSNKDEPGFSFLRRVSAGGFGFYTYKLIPDGPPLKNFHATVITDSIYEPGAKYSVKKYDRAKQELIKTSEIADSEGRLHFNLSGQGYEIGIYNEGGNPKLTFLDYSINTDEKLIRVGNRNILNLRFVNLGEELDITREISYRIHTNDMNVIINDGSGIIDSLEDQDFVKVPPVTIYSDKPAPSDARPATVKFIMTLEYDSLTFEEELDVPVFFDVPEFKDLSIDDGVMVRDTIFGTGNGDGQISAGENVMIYYGEHRTQLFTDDPYVIKDEEQFFCESFPARWNGNGMTCSSIVRISEEAPAGHVIEFLAKYETKEFLPIIRNVYWGRVKVEIKY